MTRDCKSNIRFCPLCKRKGHRAKDTHCPTYLYELTKELKKMAIPLEWMEDKDMRMTLIKSIQLK